MQNNLRGTSLKKHALRKNINKKGYERKTKTSLHTIRGKTSKHNFVIRVSSHRELHLPFHITSKQRKNSTNKRFKPETLQPASKASSIVKLGQKIQNNKLLSLKVYWLVCYRC